MPLLFTQAYLPQTCYVEEAALWLAFGRVPEPAPWGDHHENDCRSDPDYFIDTGEPYDFDPVGFTEAELQSAGVNIDYSRYVDAKIAINGKTAAEYQAFGEGQFARLMSTHGPAFRFRTGRTDTTPEEVAETYKFEREWKEKLLQEVAEGKWAEEQEAPLYSAVDRARASVFQALSRGSLKATGWVYSKKYLEWEGPEHIDVIDCGSFEDITPNEWTLRGIDWKRCTLLGPSRKYEFIQVDTDNLLETFPSPEGSLGTVSADLYCGSLIINENPETPEPQKANHRSRGRPPKADGMAKFAVQNLYGDRVRVGHTTEKSEALIQEVIEFVHRAFRVKVSRSTIQAWLMPFRGKEVLNMPEINARK